ncbi:MAG: tRNA dihydrouridine synthase DusB, partial [Bacteroidota bacterium]
TIVERVAACKQHLQHGLDWKGLKLGVLEMRRHYSNYFRGYPGIKEYRKILVTEHDPAILFATLDEIKHVYAEAQPVA